MLRVSQRILLVAGCLVLAACATRAPVPGDQWLPQVEAIAASAEAPARAAAITARLDALGIAWKREPFTSAKTRAGENLIADLGGDGAVLLIGAHYDEKGGGKGATDNASGSAAVLELAAALKARPLANHRVLLAFWDLEEEGLLGSAAWVAANPSGAELYVNFDVFGWGDTWWVMAPDGATAVIAAVQGAASAAGLPASIGTKYPPTDHLPFLKAGRPAVSFSLVDATEIEGILALYGGGKPEPMPKVMSVIHSERDQLDQLDPQAVKRALPVVLDALRRWDRDHPELASPGHGKQP